MKKIHFAAILMLLLALLVPGPAFAKNDKININGEVTAKGDGTITVLSNKGETFVVTVPAGFDLDSVQVGDSVLVKGHTADDDSVIAESIKLLGNGNDEDDGDEDEDQVEGGKENRAM